MPVNEFEHVAAGQPLQIGARTWNGLLDAAQAYQRRRLGVAEPRPLETDPLDPANRVYVQHLGGFGLTGSGSGSGTDGILPPLSVVRLGAPIFDPSAAPHSFARTPIFAAFVPGSVKDSIGIVEQGAAAGQVVRARVAGVAMCYVNVTNATHTQANPTPGRTDYLTSVASAASGSGSGSGSSPASAGGLATIIWRAGGLGVQLCAVQLCCGAGNPIVGVPGSGSGSGSGSGGSGSGSGSGSGGGSGAITCETCAGPITLPTFTLNFTAKTGVATCLPDSVSLVYLRADCTTSMGPLGYPNGVAQYLIDGAFAPAGLWVYCGGDYNALIVMQIGCEDGGFSLRIPCFKPAYPYDVLPGGPIGPPGGEYLLQVVGCDPFSTPGTVTLGTVAIGSPASSVTLVVSW